MRLKTGSGPRTRQKSGRASDCPRGAHNGGTPQMDQERWRQVETLYHATLARPAGEQAAFLAKACAGDEWLRREVQSLLDQQDSGHGAFEGGALAMAAKGFPGECLRGVAHRPGNRAV